MVLTLVTVGLIENLTSNITKIIKIVKNLIYGRFSREGGLPRQFAWSGAGGLKQAVGSRLRTTSVCNCNRLRRVRVGTCGRTPTKLLAMTRRCVTKGVMWSSRAHRTHARAVGRPGTGWWLSVAIQGRAARDLMVPSYRMWPVRCAHSSVWTAIIKKPPRRAAFYTSVPVEAGDHDA